VDDQDSTTRPTDRARRECEIHSESARLLLESDPL
jgi:hypothetical protein